MAVSSSLIGSGPRRCDIFSILAETQCRGWSYKHLRLEVSTVQSKLLDLALDYACRCSFKVIRRCQGYTTLQLASFRKRQRLTVAGTLVSVSRFNQVRGVSRLHIISLLGTRGKVSQSCYYSTTVSRSLAILILQRSGAVTLGRKPLQQSSIFWISRLPWVILVFPLDNHSMKSQDCKLVTPSWNWTW